MFAKLIEFSLTQRMFTLAVTALLIAGGAFAFSRLPIDAFPDISTTQVKIIM
ncbi:MAG: efflux RND transporter permease subunit, partial [Amphiplicatus sp.]|nr:efflux RND transporter permease subunit [Amphiplicatus sp.]